MDEYAEEKRTERNLIVRSDKSKAEVTNNKRRRSRYRIPKANYKHTRSIARPLCNSRATCVSFCFCRRHDTRFPSKVG